MAHENIYRAADWKRLACKQIRNGEQVTGYRKWLKEIGHEGPIEITKAAVS